VDRDTAAGWASTVTAILVAVGAAISLAQGNLVTLIAGGVYFYILYRISVKTLREEKKLSKTEWAVWGAVMFLNWIVPLVMVLGTWFFYGTVPA